MFLVLALLLAFGCNGGQKEKTSVQAETKATEGDRVEVIYFHGKQRWVTCRSIEERTREVMAEAGVDISKAKPKDVRAYIGESWDFVVTVCGGAAEACPVFTGKVGCRVHIGVDDPAQIRGTEEFVRDEFRRVRG